MVSGAGALPAFQEAGLPDSKLQYLRRLGHSSRTSRARTVSPCWLRVPPASGETGPEPMRDLENCRSARSNALSRPAGAPWNRTHAHVLGARPWKRCPALVSALRGATHQEHCCLFRWGGQFWNPPSRDGGRTSSSAGCGGLSFGALEVSQVLAHRSNFVDGAFGDLGGERAGGPGTLLGGEFQVAGRHQFSSCQR